MDYVGDNNYSCTVINCRDNKNLFLVNHETKQMDYCLRNSRDTNYNPYHNESNVFTTNLFFIFRRLSYNNSFGYN